MDDDGRRDAAAARALSHARTSFSITNEVEALGRVYNALLASR
jgi:mannosyltransferase